MTHIPPRADRVLRGCVVAAAVVGAILIADAIRADAVAGWPGGLWAVLANAATATIWLVAAGITGFARPRSPFGWLLFVGALCLAVSGALTGEAALLVTAGRPEVGAWVGWVGGWIFFPQLAAAATVYLLFPDGHVRKPVARLWIAVAIVADIAATVLLALTPGPVSSDGPLSRVDNPLGGFALAPTLLPVAVILLNAAFLAGIVELLLRRRLADSTMRRLLTLVVSLAVVNLVVGLLAINPPGDWVFALTVPVTIGLTGSICAGIIWGDLWDVRRTVGRVLVAAVLTALVVAVFIGIVTLSSGLLGNQFVGVAVAALLVSLLLAPAQSWLRRRIDRLLYGRRSEPYEVLSEFGAALETAGEPADGLTRLTRLAVTHLRLPGVAVVLGDDAEPVASTGVVDVQRCARFPIRYQGAAVGWLLVAHRPGELEFGGADRRLLEDLSRQTAAAAHGMASTEALRRHRSELVVVRETERRRLRRDLHDGVASGVTAIGLTTEVAEDSLSSDPARSARLLRDVRQGVTTVLADLRRVINGLGPSMLADLGMRDAIAALAARFTTDGLHVVSAVDPELPGLSPSAEEAAFWIVTESLQNVARHASASECRVSLSWDGAALTVLVEDDGRGIAAGAPRGLGLDSIRRRAEEIGGAAVIEDRQPRGTRVVASLPASVVARPELVS